VVAQGVFELCPGPALKAEPEWCREPWREWLAELEPELAPMRERTVPR
jgi:hypothetical protein